MEELNSGWGTNMLNLCQTSEFAISTGCITNAIAAAAADCPGRKCTWLADFIPQYQAMQGFVEHC